MFVVQSKRQMVIRDGTIRRNSTQNTDKTDTQAVRLLLKTLGLIADEKQQDGE